MSTLNAISIIIGLSAYLFFTVFCIVNWIRRVTGRAVFAAALLATAWITSYALLGPNTVTATLEHVLLFSWIFLLARALGLDRSRLFERRFRPVTYTFLSVLAVGAIGILGTLFAGNDTTRPQFNLTTHVSLLILNVLGMVLIEQLSKNTRSDSRWRTRYLTIGLGTYFVFGIALHSTAMLLNAPLLAMLVLQPAILGVVVPFLVVASLRNRANRLKFNVTRNFVFRTGVLVGTGLFLVLLGVFGYIAQLFAGDIGVTIAVFTVTVGIAGLLVVIGSSRTRKHLRVVLAKTFFEYRYDYREEWMRVTRQLTEPDADFDLSQQAQRAIMELLHATRSALWLKQDNGHFVAVSQVEADDWPQPLNHGLTAAIETFYRDRNWVLDLTALPPEAARLETQLHSLTFRADAHFMVPLFIETDLFGFMLLGKPTVAIQLLWEDFDIVKLVSQQCAGFLALQQANVSLRESDQLSAMNQMTAFLVHDIKTIAAQLSLMTENASRHRDNPAFIDDMLKTAENSVGRMQKILSKLKDHAAEQDAVETVVELNGLVDGAVRKIVLSSDRLEIERTAPIHVRADKEQLASAINHLTQNAIDVIDGDGRVAICIKNSGGWAEIQIKDNGPGMTAEYIENELFTPFKTTKGVSGMGIGAYQARVFVRSLGGDITVTSTVGEGSVFNIKIPLNEEQLSA